MRWWEDAFEHGRWREVRNVIFDFEVPIPDLLEMMTELRNRLRKVQRGDGVEQYADVIREYEFKSETEYMQISLLETIEISIFDRTPQNFSFNIVNYEIEEAKKSAIDVFNRHGIEFTGMNDTYIYENNGKVYFIKKDAGKAIVERREI